MRGEEKGEKKKKEEEKKEEKEKKKEKKERGRRKKKKEDKSQMSEWSWKLTEQKVSKGVIETPHVVISMSRGRLDVTWSPRCHVLILMSRDHQRMSRRTVASAGLSVNNRRRDG